MKYYSYGWLFNRPNCDYAGIRCCPPHRLSCEKCDQFTPNPESKHCIGILGYGDGANSIKEDFKSKCKIVLKNTKNIRKKTIWKIRDIVRMCGFIFITFPEINSPEKVYNTLEMVYKEVIRMSWRQTSPIIIIKNEIQKKDLKNLEQYSKDLGIVLLTSTNSSLKKLKVIGTSRVIKKRVLTLFNTYSRGSKHLKKAKGVLI